MKELMGRHVCGLIITVGISTVVVSAPLRAQQISLNALVTPSATILKDGRPLTFAIHGFVEFKSLAELFPFIEVQTHLESEISPDASLPRSDQFDPA